MEYSTHILPPYTPGPETRAGTASAREVDCAQVRGPLLLCLFLATLCTTPEVYVENVKRDLRVEQKRPTWNRSWSSSPRLCLFPAIICATQMVYVEIFKRDLHVAQKRPTWNRSSSSPSMSVPSHCVNHTCGVWKLSKETCVSNKRDLLEIVGVAFQIFLFPATLCTTPMVRGKHHKRPACRMKETYVYTNETYICTKETYVYTKEICVSNERDLFEAWERYQKRLASVWLCCSELQCVAVCCSVLQCVAARCSWKYQKRLAFVWVWGYERMKEVRCGVLQCVAVCCSVLHVSVGLWKKGRKIWVAVCCSVLPCVAVCCSVL